MLNEMSWQQQLQQLYNHIGWQSQRIDKLEQTVARLTEELSALKEQKRFHIDKIEYNFDQLKVERLEGTLTIGVSPGSLDAIEDFTVNGADASDLPRGTPLSPHNSGLEEQVSLHIQAYLETEALEDLISIEKKAGIKLEDSYRQMILDDIRGQIAERIRHYAQQVRGAGFNQPWDTVVQSIAEKTKTDIRMAMDMYISKLHNREGDVS
jgi:spore germination protein PC